MNTGRLEIKLVIAGEEFISVKGVGEIIEEGFPQLIDEAVFEIKGSKGTPCRISVAEVYKTFNAVGTNFGLNYDLQISLSYAGRSTK